MSLITLYEKAVNNKNIQDSAAQRALLEPLENLSAALSAPQPWFSWLKKRTIKGIYIYGSVGVGKTFLMDMLYENVQLAKKKRFHFHHFMQQIDTKLRQLQGHKNPLAQIAAEIADSTTLLCFDEFMVDDVAYAMILAELLQALFAKGIVLVATSNIPPDDLYKNGVQRDRFLPAIAAIKSHCDIYQLGIQHDYRLDRTPKIDTYVTPLGIAAEEKLMQQFCMLTQDESSSVKKITIQNREIPCIKCIKSIVWFDFKIICNLPRSQLDYLEIANHFDTVIVSDIPALREKDTVFVILLIHFVDVMYDQGIRLILSAAVPIEELYTHGEMVTVFKRTASRLQEMQSADYVVRHQCRKLQSMLA